MMIGRTEPVLLIVFSEWIVLTFDYDKFNAIFALKLIHASIYIYIYIYIYVIKLRLFARHLT